MFLASLIPAGIIRMTCGACESTQWEHDCEEARCMRCTAKQAEKRARFDKRAPESREVVAYSTVYGIHPRDFNFEANGSMTPSAYRPLINPSTWHAGIGRTPRAPGRGGASDVTRGYGTDTGYTGDRQIERMIEPHRLARRV